MLVLGIESTCDETGVSVVEDGTRILSNVVVSQVPLHERFGGVVPEIASRAHVEVITRMVDRALRDAGLAPPSPSASGGSTRPVVDAIAVAHRPGLVGSLLVGLTAAKTLAFAWDLPLVGVDHIHAHIYASFLSSSGSTEPPVEEEELPAVSLVVSGGHTSLYLSRSWTDHRLLGSTIDDAVGESFDKAAALLGLGYPGGPAISAAAKEGNPDAVKFPRTLLDRDSLDFSFSGIKTAVLYHVKGQNAGRDAPIREGVSVPDVAASFEAAACEVLVEKLRRALRREGVSRIVLGGGVAANRRLRHDVESLARELGASIRFPDLALCTDNAAMIAGLGAHVLRVHGPSDLDLDVSTTTSTDEPRNTDSRLDPS